MISFGRAGHISFPWNKIKDKVRKKKRERNEQTKKRERTKVKVTEGLKTVFVSAIVAPVAIHELSRPMKVNVVQALHATSSSPLAIMTSFLHDVTMGLSPSGQCQCIQKALLYILLHSGCTVDPSLFWPPDPWMLSSRLILDSMQETPGLLRSQHWGWYNIHVTSACWGQVTEVFNLTVIG